MKNLNEDIKTGNFKQAYLLYGEEAYLKKQYKVIPDDVWKQLCAETDTALYYERNDDLYDSANQFFESRLK